MRVLGKRGDTIIEVLIAIAVVGSIMTGAYAVATRSLNGVRVSQERGEALKIAESQIEIIKGRLESIGNFNDPLVAQTVVLLPPIATTNPPQKWFCLSSGSTPLQPFNLTADNTSSFSEYNAACIQGRYHIAVTTQDSSKLMNGGDEIGRVIRVRVGVYWERAGGGGIERLELNYKATI
jgi:prepilin-type N-terminal cleavage/methylation domain-containing protein